MADRMMNFHSSILQVASIIKNKEQRKAKEKIDMEKKKRDRKANYSKQETDRLVELIIIKKDILESKKNTADQWNEKREAWEDIEREFNKKPGSGAIYRDSKNLRIKFESLKRDIKRKWNSILANKKSPNGKMPKFSTAEKKIKDIISLPMEGFCDFDSFDDNKDNKSEDGDTSDSCISISNIEDLDCETVKKEAGSDDEADGFAYHNVTLDEPSIKSMREDPLIGLQRHQNNNKNNEEPANERIRVNSFLESQNGHSTRIIERVDIEEEKLKSRLQLEILKEELEIKKIQRQLLEQELEHKKSVNQLEKDHLFLKIKALTK